MGVSVRTAAAAAIVVLAAPVLAQQQQPPTFRSGTQVVEVDVRVFDKDGRFVTDLTAEDFEITEDGQPQAIQSLTLVGAEPAEPAPSAPSAPSAPAPTAPRAPSTLSTHQTWVFLFDTTHLSPGGLHRTRDAVAKFIDEHFHEGDLAGVIADGKMIGNRLTTNHEELVQAVNSIKMPGPMLRLQNEVTREWPRLQDLYEAWLIDEKNDPHALGAAVGRACSDDPQLCPNARPMVRSKAANVNTEGQSLSRLTLYVLDALAHGLARVPGPKTVVFLSEGFLIWGAQSQLRDVVGQINRAGAHIYAIDARGLDKGRNSKLLTMDQADDLETGSPMFDEQVDASNSLAIDTGGMFIENFNDIGRPLEMIQRDAGTYYVLGYAPANQTFDGKYREIRVHVKRDGVKVRARRGYLAIEPAKMLTPVSSTPASDIPAGSKDPAYDKNAPDPDVGRVFRPAEAPAPNRTDAPAPVIEPTTASALRTEIEGGGFVTELRKTEAPAEASPAAKGWAAYQRGDVETAVRELTTAAASPDAHAWVHYVLGLGHLALADYPHAASSWERVRTMAPDFEPVYMNLADAYLLQKDGASALKVLEAARARWPKDDEVYNAIGVILLRAGSTAKAVDSFKRAIKVNPREGLGYFNLASAYHVFYNARPTITTDRQFRMAHQVRDMAIANYRKYLSIGGPYDEQAKVALKALNAAK